jgi:hypothetical protein
MPPRGRGWYGFLTQLSINEEEAMRDRDQHRHLRKPKMNSEQVISREEIEERIDNLNEETEKRADTRRQEDFDRQKERDRE